ncbi:hypothetical protein [Alienimonas californiensis]|uniref:Uncharacterized protein n=1 Tax=Alienimonas californiensis TaxID=2527989 RepID=A0A517PAN4_9PLAN|nr:hypothetical protein [Alienimonas californiensis]QDT16432.1 hypothetical protein CA12_25340 [Alienimonas californiensis]
MNTVTVARLSAAACAALLFAAPAPAGGLVWNLPEPGTQVRHEGSYTQTLTDEQNQVTTVERRRQITLRALEAETATVDGEQVPARWLEIVSETGAPGERGLETGPAGRVLYKVLVPESGVIGRPADDNGIPQAFLPVIRGWKQVGNGEPTEYGPVLRAYPTLTLLKEYEPAELTEEGAAAADTPAGQFEGTRYQGRVVEESDRARVTNVGQFVVSPDVPFGPAQWEVTLTRESKDLSEPRDAYRETSKTVVRMSVAEISAGARGELPLP